VTRSGCPTSTLKLSDDGYEARRLQHGRPWALATLLEAAGPGAEEQVGRIRARRQPA